MRRVLGAAVLVLGIGASDLSYFLIHSHHLGRRPDGSPIPASSRPAPALFSYPPSPPTRAAGYRPAASSAPPSFAHDPLAFLSRAPADSLDLLPGIGPVLAMRIVEARRGRGSFTSWDDVLRVRGIGPKTIERLKVLASRR